MDRRDFIIRKEINIASLIILELILLSILRATIKLKNWRTVPGQLASTISPEGIMSTRYFLNQRMASLRDINFPSSGSPSLPSLIISNFNEQEKNHFHFSFIAFDFNQRMP